MYVIYSARKEKGGGVGQGCLIDMEVGERQISLAKQQLSQMGKEFCFRLFLWQVNV